MKSRNFFCGVFLFVSACSQKPQMFDLAPVSYGELSGWSEDSVAEAIPAFLRSCQALEKKDSGQAMRLGEAGLVRDWQDVCVAAQELDPSDEVDARTFFESSFVPYKIDGTGLFTGYYEATLRGARERGGLFQTPLWGRPRDLISVELGRFKKELAGQKIVGKLEENRLVPYDDRAAIAAEGLQERAEALYWTDDPVAAFFLEIQGSGRVYLDDGSEARIGFAAQNGHPYTPIGRVLVEEGAIEKPVTMAKIRTWLEEHPERRQEVMNKNPSAVFFTEIAGEGPIGAQGVALTPLRSMAVDPRYVPLGTPLWFVGEKHRRLVVAQDTGGAIKGAVRGDLFWGAGVAAEEGAGEMQESGTYYLLLPRRATRP